MPAQAAAKPSTFTQLSDALTAAIGFELPLKDEWRTWAHALIVPMHSEWCCEALQLCVQPARGRRAARIGASVIIDTKPDHYTVTPEQAAELIAWADGGAIGTPDCIASGAAIKSLG